MTRGKGKNEEDEWIDQVQSEVQRGRVPTYIGGASPINDHDVYVRKWEVISNNLPPAQHKLKLTIAPPYPHIKQKHNQRSIP